MLTRCPTCNKYRKLCDFPQVTMEFSDKKVSPGEETSIHLEAAAGSVCGVGVVDKSVNILGGDHQITPKKVRLVALLVLERTTRFPCILLLPLFCHFSHPSFNPSSHPSFHPTSLVPLLLILPCFLFFLLFFLNLSSHLQQILTGGDFMDHFHGPCFRCLSSLLLETPPVSGHHTVKHLEE